VILEIAHTVDDLHFTGKDLCYVAGFLVTFLSAWFKLKFKADKQDDKIKSLTKTADTYYRECKDEFVNAKNGRISIRNDFNANISSNNLVFTGRLDTMDKEIKEVNASINKVNVSLSEVKAKLDILMKK
tara:strand:- start:1087 stop:1473 length:387 start_codon:yes stop_codon:yes gene_type:complete